MKHSIFRIFFTAFILLFLFSACTTTGKAVNSADGETDSLSDSKTDAADTAKAEQTLAFQNKFIGNSEYIFIRIYNPAYKNPLYIANLLKSGIALTEVNGIMASHSAINFDLTDSFIGLTQFSRPQLKAEHCTAVAGNEYMNACDPYNSEQRTYAIKVTPEECQRAKDIIKAHAHIRYDTLQNFYFAGYSVRRKFFSRKEDRSLKRQKKNTTGFKLKDDVFQKDFVCSTFIAYILVNSVESVRKYFEENQINYNFVSVTDLTQIPGIEFLFSSTWSLYRETAGIFASTDYRFKDYFDW